SSGSESRLAESFRAGADPTLDVAKLLFAPNEDDGNRGRAFEALRARDPEPYSRCVTLVRLFLEGVPRGLAPDHLPELIRQELGADLTGVDVERGYNNVAKKIFPEFVGFLLDTTIDILLEKLACDPTELWDLRGGRRYRRDAAVLRDVLAGRSQS